MAFGFAIVGALLGVVSTDAATLRDDFLSPPREAKPQVWYAIMNGNASKEGVTADFEALAAAGIGGVQLFDVSYHLPRGRVDFASDDWYDLLLHADAEARRLGLEMCIMNCSGWSASGGPWNAPADAMKEIVFRRVPVAGGERYRGRLPELEDPFGFHADIAVLAVKVPSATSAGPFAGTVEKRTIMPGCEELVLRTKADAVASGYSYRFDFPEDLWRAFVEVSVEISRDGDSFEPYDRHTIALCRGEEGSREFRFRAFKSGPERVRALRITFSFKNGSGEKPYANAHVVDVRLERKLALQGLEEKILAWRGDILPPTYEGTPEQVVAKSDVINLTGRVGADGSLDWTAPAGSAWEILRVGYACNGQRNEPPTPAGEGLEVDKLSAVAVERHFNAYVGEFLRRLGGRAGGRTGFNNCIIDSYESGCQNWTAGLETDFRNRMGYDLIPYLPIFAGYVVGSADETERVLWDFRRLIADLFAERYAGTVARLCHERGLSFSLEPYTYGPFDCLQYGRHADIPMCEFWTKSRLPGYSVDTHNARVAGSVGHVWGRRFIGAEAFTSDPDSSGAWLSTPELIKSIGDAAYADGVNRIIYNSFVHQSDATGRYVPGLTMGQYGIHLSRYQTWWRHFDAFASYETRCQALLQRGEPVADILFWSGEDAPNNGDNEDGGYTSPYRMPFGWNWDVCETEALLGLRVEKDGALVTPGGTHYRTLVLPPSRTMRTHVLDKIADLVNRGASVCGKVRPTLAPGLVGYPSASARIAAESKEIWGRIAAEPSVPPDLVLVAGKEPKWIHRRDDSADWYFICRNNIARESMTLSFRQSGRVPEIWNPETRSILRPRSWHDDGERTTVTLDFEPAGAAFVVFPKRPFASAAETRRDRLAEFPVEGAWDLSFETLYEGTPKPRSVERLGSLTDDPDPDVRFFAGTVAYEKTIDISDVVAQLRGSDFRLALDLGRVRDFAEVTVNGKAFPVLWKPPYCLDITDAVASNSCFFKIKVTNRWPNRLIGDDALAPDVEWAEPFGSYQPLKSMPDWVSEGGKSPTGRHTFTTWRFWKSGDRLLESGLLGPVCLVIEKVCTN